MTTAILVAALIPFLLGFLWYSDALFGKAWLEAIGKSKEEIEPDIARHAVSVVGWLAASFVFVSYQHRNSFKHQGVSVSGYCTMGCLYDAS